MSDMLEFAKDMAKEAGKLIRDNYGKIKTKEMKADKSSVTNVDKESEALIISRIKKKFPDHAILSEESGSNNKKSEYLWIIDPIDGTRNFMHEIPLFSVSIGLVKNNRPYIGVVYFPILDEIYHAEKGKGAFLNGKKIHVSARTIKDMPLMSYGANIFEKDVEWHKRKVSELVKITSKIRMFGCATVNMSYLAAGRFDAFIGRYGKIWDYAASIVIVNEAGGKITDIEGKPYTMETTDFVVSNGKFHDELIKITKS